MVRSPRPVPAGFGLDDGEVCLHLAVVAIRYLILQILLQLCSNVNHRCQYRREIIRFFGGFEYSLLHLQELSPIDVLSFVLLNDPFEQALQESVG